MWLCHFAQPPRGGGRRLSSALGALFRKCGFATFLNPRGGRPAPAGLGALLRPGDSATRHNPLGRLLALVLAQVLAGLVCLPVGAQVQRATVAMPLHQVGARVWMVQGQSALGSALNQGFVSNAGFVVTDGGVLVVDGLGTPALAQRLLEAIATVTAQPVRYVVVTHYHADHIYGLQAFKAAGATIVGHVAARDYLGSDTARNRLAASREELFPWIDETTRLVEPDLWVDGATTLRLGSTLFELHPVGPAHTPEDLTVTVVGAGVVFSGDLVFNGRVPFVGGADSGRWMASLDRLLALRPQRVVPGHGPVSTDPASDLRQTRDYLAHLRATMGQAARDLEPFEQAYAQADWSRFEAWPLFRLVNRMNAYNTYLLMEQQAR